MIGKIIGAYVGDRLARQTSAIGGASGAALGVVASTVLRRMSLPTMIAFGVGGYVVKKALDRRQAEEAPVEEASPAKPAKAAKRTRKSKVAQV